jgi:hypothetical protein
VAAASVSSTPAAIAPGVSLRIRMTPSISANSRSVRNARSAGVSAAPAEVAASSRP